MAWLSLYLLCLGRRYRLIRWRLILRRRLGSAGIHDQSVVIRADTWKQMSCHHGLMAVDEVSCTATTHVSCVSSEATVYADGGQHSTVLLNSARVQTTRFQLADLVPSRVRT